MTEVFVVSQFAELAGLSREAAGEWLDEFARAGVCERVAGGWVLTSKGAAIGKGLALCGEDDNHNRDGHGEDR